MLGRAWTSCGGIRQSRGWPNITKSHSQVFVPISRRFFIFNDMKSRRKIYEKKRLVGYTEEQMFNVVSDVENYQNFLPWCKKSYVHGRRDNFLKCDMIIGFPPLHEKYTSNVTMTKPGYIKAECMDGRIFNYLLTVWRFSRGLKDIPGSCVVDVHVAFEFKSYIHSQITNMFFDQIIKQMEDSFIKAAESRYGDPAIKSQVLAYKSS